MKEVIVRNHIVSYKIMPVQVQNTRGHKPIPRQYYYTITLSTGRIIKSDKNYNTESDAETAINHFVSKSIVL